jgi:hypothetical protein
MKKVLRRPSPAMIVAIVALIAALGGTAIAGGVINKKKAKNIANNVVTQRAPGLSVSHAVSADNANNANNANNLGGTAASGFPKVSQFAYGEISDTGAVKSSPPNRNIVAASNPSTGLYCLDLAFSPTWGEAGSTGASGTQTHVSADIPATNCGSLPGADASVYVLNSAGTFINDDFTVVFGGF